MKIFFLILGVLLGGSLAIAQEGIPGSNHDPDFFPIAVWAQNSANASAYKEHGINMFIHIYGGLDQEKFDYLKEAGMKVIAHQNDFGLTKLNEPLIYGWMHGDEPDNAQRNKAENKWDPCREPSGVIGDYKKIRKNDPSRPVYLNVGRGVAYTDWIGRGTCRGRTDMYKVSNDGYLKGCDIASFDIYPVNSSEQEVEGQLWYVAKGIENLRQWTDHIKPVWCWIETTRISEKSKRKPTPAEVRSEVWMALVHGAKGFGYFCHTFVGKMDDAALLHDTEMIQAVKAINEQVTSLAPVLNSPDLAGYASAKSSNGSVPIDILAKRAGKVHYIFAVAMRNGLTNVTFSVRSGKHVEVLGENRALRIKHGKFTDEFSGYGVHLYKITTGPSPKPER